VKAGTPSCSRAARDAVIPPEDVLGPHLLAGIPIAGLRRLVIARKTNRAERVEETGTLRERVDVGRRLRCVLQQRLDGVRRQVRVRLQHQGDGARHNGRRHAGTAEAEVGLVGRRNGARHQVRRLRPVELAGRIDDRDGADARRYKVGLGRPVEVGRTTRTEGRDGIIGSCNRAVGCRCTDSQHPWRVTRRVDAAVLRQPLGVLAEVAGRRDHNYPSFNNTLGCKRERVG